MKFYQKCDSMFLWRQLLLEKIENKLQKTIQLEIKETISHLLVIVN